MALYNVTPWISVGDGVSVRSVSGSELGYSRNPLPPPPPMPAPTGGK